MYLIHPSSIGKLMAEPTAKAKKDGEILSVGAKTFCKTIAQQIVYGFTPELDVKYVRKGLECESAAIALLNSVYFKNYVKNTVRIKTDLLSGECDILAPDMIRDTKASWSLETFPSLKEDAHSDLYEWQGRAYMHLYDRPEFRLDYCLVTTPPELRRYESPLIHEVDHIPEELRVTTVIYQRCAEKEALMLEKCRAAQNYIDQIQEQILIDHDCNY